MSTDNFPMLFSDGRDTRNVRDPIGNILAWRYSRNIIIETFTILVIIFPFKKKNISEKES